jgi:hypothetical protein
MAKKGKTAFLRPECNLARLCNVWIRIQKLKTYLLVDVHISPFNSEQKHFLFEFFDTGIFHKMTIN